MIRRNARLRREYLYRKSLEGKEKTTYEKKQKIKNAVAGQHALARAVDALPALGPSLTSALLLCRVSLCQPASLSPLS